jgi:hypothetical protein
MLAAAGFGPSALGAALPVPQADSTGGVTVTADEAWPALHGRNYAYVRTQIRNDAGEPRTLRIQAQLWVYGGFESEVQRQVLEIPAGEDQEIEWVLPQWADRGQGYVSFTVDGMREPGRFDFQPVLQPRGSDIIDHSLVVVTGQALSAGWNLDQSTRLSGRSLPDLPAFREPAPLSMSSEFEWSRLKHDFDQAGIQASMTNSQLDGRPLAPSGLYEVTRMDAGSLPDCIEPYTAISALLLDTDSLPLPGSRMRRVEDWVLSGGTLVLAGNALEVARSSTHLSTALDPRDELARFGDTSVHRCGLGQLILAEGSTPLLVGSGQDEALWWVLERLPSFLGRGPKGDPAWRLFHPSIGNLSIQPYRTLAGTLVGIVLLLGPGALWFVRRRGQPVLLLFVLPVVGLILTVLVGGYGVLRHGVSVRESLTSLTVLDQQAGLMQNFASRQLYAGLATGQRLQPAASTVVLPRLFRERSGPRGVQSGTLRFSGQAGRREFGGAYLPARQAVRHDAVSVRLDRQRLDVEPGAQAPEARSGFECDLTALVYRDADGAYWEAPQGLSKGGRQALVPSDEETALALLRGITPGVGLPGLDELAPASYAAVLEEGVFTDDLELNTRVVGARHGLVGRLDPGSAGGSESQGGGSR